MSNKSKAAAGIAAALGCVVLLLLWMRRADAPVEHTDASETASSASSDAREGQARARRGAALSGRALRSAESSAISGKVLDARGQAIEGARVCATPKQDELRGAGEPRPRCAQSGADGYYRIEGLLPVKTGVAASAPSFEPARWEGEFAGEDTVWVRLQTGQTRSGVDLKLEPGGVAVRGVVRDISGGVIEDALVIAGGRWSFSAGGMSTAVTDEEGRFELWAAPGVVRLRAQAEGYAESSHPASAPTELAELFLTPESVLAGVVIHAETKQPLAGVPVSANSGMFGRGGNGETLSDAQGRFRIAGLSPGSYELLVRDDELYGEGVERVHLGLAQSAEDLVIEAHPALYVSGTVRLDDGETPCPGGRVELTAKGAQSISSQLDDEGHATLRGLMPGEYEVDVSCSKYVTEPEYEPVVLAEASVEGLVWEVHEGHAIRGVVVDGSGQPVAEVSVSARAKTDADDPRAQQTSAWGAETEADGAFELRGLLSASYELRIYSSEHPRLDEATEVVVEGADVEDIRLELPASGVVRGIVRDEQGQPVPGVQVEARPQQGRQNRRTTRSGDDGRFEITGLALGPTRVSAQQNWFETMRAPGTTDDDLQGEVVEVVASAAAELELLVESQSASIRGRVVDSSGAPIGDAFVSASRISDRAGASAARSRAQLNWGWDRKPKLSEQDGSFELSDLAEGEYLVRAYRKGGGEAVLEGVAAGSRGVELAIVDTGEILGQVVLAGGGSPERFDLSAHEEVQFVHRSDSFFRTGGAFALRELPPGTYELSVQAPEGSARTEVTLGAGESVAELRLELTPRIDLRGRLIDGHSGAPVRGMKVSVQSGGRMSFSMDGKGKEEISDAEGRFEVEDAPAGKVQLVIMPRNWSEDTPYGWNFRDLNLPSEASSHDLGDIELIARRLGRDEQPGDLGYTLEDAPPGLEPEQARFKVALVRPGGPAEGSGLEPGDEIIEVDGQSVSGLDSHRYGVLTRAAPGTELRLTTKSGKQIQLVLGPPRQ